MEPRNLHMSLKSNIEKKIYEPMGEFLIVKLQYGKNDELFSLHVSPSSISLNSIQLDDFLKILGFQESKCQFTANRKCFVKLISASFNLEEFADDVVGAFLQFRNSIDDLSNCGFYLPKSDDWHYQPGQSYVKKSLDLLLEGDGHNGMTQSLMQEASDDFMQYKLSWLISNNGRGWIFHYRPKRAPISSEIESVFQFLGMQQFMECPNFDFEPCFWRSIKLHGPESVGVGQGNDLSLYVPWWFSQHSTHFSSGIQKILESNSKMEKYGFQFLPIHSPASRLKTDLYRKTVVLNKMSHKSAEQFDIAISFAGPERLIAEKLAKIVKEAGHSVFFDDFYADYLWGKNLFDTFNEIYSKRARYCVIFVSKEYSERMWTNHERQSAQARALEEKGNEYILPIKIDETALKGMSSTLGYVDISVGIEKIAQMLIKKLTSH
jgi:hypothetical protein